MYDLYECFYVPSLFHFRKETTAKIPTFTGYSRKYYLRTIFFAKTVTLRFFGEIFAKTKFRDFSSNLMNVS